MENTAQVGDSNSETITHANHSKLRYGVLLKVFRHKLAGISKSEFVPCWSKIFFQHRLTHIQNENEVTNDSSLQWSRVLEKSTYQRS